MATAPIEKDEARQEDEACDDVQPEAQNPVEVARRILAEVDNQQDQEFVAAYRDLCARYSRRLVVDRHLYVERVSGDPPR